MKPHGFSLLVATLALLAVLGAVAGARLSLLGLAAQRDRVSERSLGLAREALLAYAADRAINTTVGPGYLPCPDLDDDGWAEATCGSMTGDSGQDERLGRLPWKTLGLPDLRDGSGERLWYAVSSKYKGLLNCAASRACLDMSPASALGTISVRDASGTLLHDGTSGDPARAGRGGAIAVVIAPGPALPGQSRDCLRGECARAANYLDGVPAGEDNADFVDRNDAPGRARNANGFVQGPILGPDGTFVVNDRIAVLAYGDVMPRVMKRVALEAAHCLRAHASPAPASACDGRFGAIPDAAIEGSACSASLEDRTWWQSWKAAVFYGPGEVIVAGAPLERACERIVSGVRAAPDVVLALPR